MAQTTLPEYSAAVLAHALASPDLTGTAAGALRDSGWHVVQVTAARLRAVERSNWDIVVIPTTRVDEEILLLATRAARHPATCVAFISPDRDPQHIADVLRSGVDTYLVAPFQTEEFLARLTSLAAHARGKRRGQSPAPPATGPARVSLDPATRSLRDGAVRVSLSLCEWDVLSTLLAHGEQLTTASELATSLWGTPQERARIVSTISRLRRKLSSAGVRTLNVVTVRGVGYAVRMT